MKIFGDRLKSLRNSGQGQPVNTLHSVEAFQFILQRERIRTERTGLEFSLVVFNEENVLDYSQYIESLLDVLFRRVRLTDEVGWFDERKIGAILPSTSAEGAMTFANDICQKVSEKGLSLTYKIYTYPTQWPTPGIGFPEKAQSSNLRSTPVEGMERFLVRRTSALKRGFDIMGSTLGLILFSPVMLTVAAAIKFTSKGPILYKQERIGFLGKKFNFLKFRSMYVNQPTDIHQDYIEKFIKKGESHREQGEKNNTYKIKNDPRVTSVGKFLRKTSIDELPQLINVLKGEMSLVGPRPPIPYECEYYDRWHNRRILGIKPGVTGLWQVKGRSRTTFEEMVRQDLRYIREWSLWLDIKILFQTPWAVFSGKGAY